MAQVSLTVLQSSRPTNVNRFILDTKKIVGLVELTSGYVTVTFKVGDVIERVVVAETYDEIADVMLYGQHVPNYEEVE